MSAIAEKIAYVLDFDGTVTTRDISALLPRRFGGARYEAVLEAYNKQDDFGMKRWLKEASAFLPADLELLHSLAMAQAAIRPGLREFLEFARRRERPVYIASDGFGFYIEPILEKFGCLPYIAAIYKNEAAAGANGTLEIATVHAHRTCEVCGNCKAALVAALRDQGCRVIYAGDGGNDRYGASRADLVFARDRLAAVCAASGIPFTPWRDFHDLIRPAPPAFDAAPAAPLCDPC